MSARRAPAAAIGFVQCFNMARRGVTYSSGYICPCELDFEQFGTPSQLLLTRFKMTKYVQGWAGWLTAGLAVTMSRKNQLRPPKENRFDRSCRQR